MPYVDIHADFDRTAAKARQKELSAEMPEGLGINRTEMYWASAWDHFIDERPTAFYNHIAHNLPHKVSVFVDFNGARGGELNVSVSQAGKDVLETNNKLMSDVTGRTLRFEEWTVADVNQRHKGLGLTLFSNLLDFAQQAGFDRITLRAGRDEGRFFWARHGFYLKDDHHLNRFIENVETNLNQLGDVLGENIQQQVRDILAEKKLDASWKIARLPWTIDGMPIGVRLMDGCNPEYILNLHDDEQIDRTRRSLIRESGQSSMALVHN